MGIAIIIPGVSFADNNLGKVTLGSGDDTDTIKVTSITISGDSIVNTESNSATYSVAYTPSDTTQKGVTWSIESGGDYATIDQSGVLTVKGTGSVVIKATSKYNSAVVARKTVSTTLYNVEPSEPVNVQKLEYIGTEGGNYLQTAVTLKTGRKVFAKANLHNVDSPTSTMRQFVLHDGSTYCIGNTYKEKIFSAYLPFRKIQTTTPLVGVVEFTVSKYTADLTLDGTAVDDATVSNNNQGESANVKLYANGSASLQHKRVDIYSYKVEEDGTALINLVPVLKDNKPCFHDTVSDTYLEITGSQNIYYATKTEPEKELTYNG